MSRARLFVGPAMVLVLGSACELPTSDPGEVADVAGVWDYSGTQDVPSRELVGTLTLVQAGDELSGTLSWSEEDPVGNIETRGGAVVGLVLGTADVDFDVTLSGDDRRHLARIIADTLEGAWTSLSSGAAGTFRARRRP